MCSLLFRFVLGCDVISAPASIQTWADEKWVQVVFVASNGGFPKLVQSAPRFSLRSQRLTLQADVLFVCLVAVRGSGAKDRAIFETVEGMDDEEAKDFLKVEGLWQAQTVPLLGADRNFVLDADGEPELEDVGSPVMQEAIRLGCDRLKLLRLWAKKRSPDGAPRQLRARDTDSRHIRLVLPSGNGAMSLIIWLLTKWRYEMINMRSSCPPHIPSCRC